MQRGNEAQVLHRSMICCIASTPHLQFVRLWEYILLMDTVYSFTFPEKSRFFYTNPCPSPPATYIFPPQPPCSRIPPRISHPRRSHSPLPARIPSHPSPPSRIFLGSRQRYSHKPLPPAVPPKRRSQKQNTRWVGTERRRVA